MASGRSIDAELSGDQICGGNEQPAEGQDASKSWLTALLAAVALLDRLGHFLAGMAIKSEGAGPMFTS